MNGQTFRDWFINDYMISNETLLHTDPKTGASQVIGLGWLDDSMSIGGPSEEDKHYIADTGASAESMMEQTNAYRTSMYELTKKVVPMGGFWWQLMDRGGNKLAAKDVSAASCKATLKSLCVGGGPNASATPSAWDRMQLYNIPNGGEHTTEANFTDYTAEFLLTRGPYVLHSIRATVVQVYNCITVRRQMYLHSIPSLLSSLLSRVHARVEPNICMYACTHLSVITWVTSQVRTPRLLLVWVHKRTTDAASREGMGRDDVRRAE